MALLIDSGWLVLGLVALYFGAEWLVNGASKGAVKYGVSPLVVGLTVVAFGTSAPELFVSIGFNFGGSPDMAIGNVVGSNICNIALVMGVSAFICVLTVKSELLLRDLPVALVATIGFSWMLFNGNVGRIEGGILFGSVIAYTYYQLIIARKVKNPEVLEEFEEGLDLEDAECEPLWKLIFLVLAGLVVLYLGAEALKTGGVGLAKSFGVPEAVIALTLIAFSTSVPELATSVIASLRKEGDIIIGNVIGSCIFNILCVVGATAILKPLPVSQINPVDIWVMLGLTTILIPIMWSNRRVSRWEGGFLLVIYAVYCVNLWKTSGV